MAVSVRREPSFEAGIPQALFDTHIPFAIEGSRSEYAVTADGQRFLVNTPEGGAPPPTITVVMNWTADLKK